MIHWTDSGRDALERHLASIRPDLLATGLDPETTAALLRQQVEVQLTRENISTATAEEVTRVLARGAKGPAKPAAATRPPKPFLPGWFGRSVMIVFGVLLPLAALGIEMATHVSADFFDPIPTPWHAVAILAVAAANLVSFAVLAGERMNSWLGRIAAIQGVAAGIALFFALGYAVLSPFAVVAIIFLGIGFLPLSPLLSLIVALVLRVRLRRKAVLTGQVPGKFWPWAAVGLALMVLLELPGFVEAWAVRTTVTGEAGQQARALRVLRQYGDEERILRGCYYRRSDLRDGVYHWLFGTHSMEAQQSVYYRMTGRPFNHQPPPQSSTWTSVLSERNAETREWIWDDSQGGTEVGRRLRALHLTQSRIDGKVEGDAAVGYLEWTMVFRNDHEFQQREARALVQLPAGAVVSRVTLWIDGEEREAAFGGRSQVRQAYQAVVQRRRDPVLVTAAGPGRVLVQCFPVEPKGGEMKIRLGISVPLALADLESARLTLPRVIEQNYSPAAGLAHAVWIESTQALSSPLTAYQADSSSSGRQVLRASLTPAQFLSPAAGITVARDPAITRTWTRHPLDAGAVIEQTIAREPAQSGPIVIVVDGSGNLAEAARLLAGELERWPAARVVQLVIATDTPVIFRTGAPQVAATFLRQTEFVGGQDASRGLLAALDLLGSERGTVLWIHGAQPVTWQDAAVLEQRLARRRGQARLLTLAAVRGPNVVLDKLGESPDLAVLPRGDEFGADLKQCFAQWDGQGWVARRHVIPAGQAPAGGTEASSHLARLWAADEVARLLADGQVNREKAVNLAVRMQLVTALSGAVVLETQQQYDAAGLKPVDSSTVPSVPERAATFVLLIGGLAILALVARRQRGRAVAATGSG